MSETVFNVVTCLGFTAAVLNYRLVSHGEINRPLYVFILCCFVYSEAYVALTQPAMWLYVLLSLWGLWNFWSTRG